MDLKGNGVPHESANGDEIRDPLRNIASDLDSSCTTDPLSVKTDFSDSKIKNDSQFETMETVPLEISVQGSSDSVSLTMPVENTETVSLQMRSVSLTDKELSSTVTFQQRSHTVAEPTSLSKYFEADIPQLQKVDPVGISFFDSLAAKDPCKQIDSAISTEKDQEKKDEKDISPLLESKKSVDETDKVEANPPTLLKFFSEDKCGKDADGKAFFDIIAGNKSPESGNILMINESILSQNAEDNILSSSALSSDIEEAWMPSEKTRQTLVALVTSSTALTLDKSQLTTPGVIIEKDMVDPVKTLLIECNSPQAQFRKTLTENDVTADEKGLQKLMEAGCYNAALNLTKRLLKACGQGFGDDGKISQHTPLSLRLWYVRLALFIKLQRCSYAEVEGAAFGDLDKPDLYYEYYSDTYKGKKGTMVPFPLRLLLAELPQYQGNHQVALDNLYQIHHVIQKMLKNIQNDRAEDGSMIELSESRKAASIEIWSRKERRVLYSILNCVLSQKDFVLAVSIAKMLIEKSKGERPQLFSALGRIYLQLGDVKLAQDCFNKAVDLSQDNPQNFQAEIFINKALLAIAYNDNEDAYKYYEEAYAIRPHDAMLANNMAVCLLYMGKLKESLDLLEKTIQTNPVSCLHDGLLFNICTLYELESSRCPLKKIAMLELVAKVAGDSFNVSCLKIQAKP